MTIQGKDVLSITKDKDIPDKLTLGKVTKYKGYPNVQIIKLFCSNHTFICYLQLSFQFFSSSWLLHSKCLHISKFIFR